MKILSASLYTVVLRFYFLTFYVIGVVLTGHMPWALLALPIFLSAILAVRIFPEKVKPVTSTKVRSSAPTAVSININKQAA